MNATQTVKAQQELIQKAIAALQAELDRVQVAAVKADDWRTVSKLSKGADVARNTLEWLGVNA